MSAPEDTAATPEILKRSVLPKIIIVACAALILLLGALFAGARYGVLLPQARLLIEARANGLKIGRFGRLKVEGLSGDVWRDFKVRRLTITDEKGVWLEGRNLHLVWSYPALLQRNFQADLITAEQVRILRRPTLSPKGKAGGMPVSFHIAEARGRIEMLPALSYRHGIYDVQAALDIERSGRRQGKITAASRLHDGDHLLVEFDLGKTRPLHVLADAVEAKGGALAGALGLPADRPFALKIVADGKMSEGRFTAVAISGAERPLLASGAWSPGGGRAGGRLDLGASTLTESYARRFGRVLVFGAGGRKADAHLFGLGLRLDAENLKLFAKGLGNVGERRAGPQGLGVTVATNDLKRVIGAGPVLGPTRLNGVLTGQASDWRYQASGGLEGFELAGYRLARAAGPVEVSRRKGIITLKADLTGAGGAGRGLLTALLGDRPHAQAAGSRLADGRLLLQSVDLTGAGIRAQATGARSLLGGLNFKGKAQISNLAAAKVGATGGVAGGWSATQARGGDPWVFTVDAKGERFATGFAELDRLLGGAPAFKGQMSLAKGRRIEVASASLAGTALRAQSAGVLEGDGALKFKLDWNADGPFRAGPLEITGKAKGAGAITGTLSAPRADLLADFDAIDVPRVPLKNAHVTVSFVRQPDGSSGLFTLAADSGYGPARAKSNFRFPQGGVDLTDLAVDAGGVKAAGSLALRRRTPSAADLTLAVGKGALLDSGRLAGTLKIVDGAGGPRAAADLRAENAVLKGSPMALASGRITANGPLARLPYAIQATGQARDSGFTLNGRGLLAQEAQGYAISFDGAAQAGGRNLRTLEPALIRFAAGERTARLRLAAADGARIDLNGRLAKDEASVRAELNRVGLSLFDEDMAGDVSGTLTLQGRGGRLDGLLDAQLQGARGRGTDPATGLNGALRARLADNSIILQADAVNAQGLKANAALTLPAEASAAPFRIAVARTRPMQGRFFADGEIKPLWDLLIGGERTLSGRARMEGTLGGTLADPKATGQAALEGGRFEDGATGLVLRNLLLRASFANTAIDVTQAQGDDGHGGRVSGGGRISLYRQGVSSFRLALDNFRLIDNEQATASATGQATINRAANGQVRLAGALEIDRADVAADPPVPSGVTPMEVVEINRPVSLKRTLAPPPRRGAGWALDVELKAPRRVFLRGRGLDLEMSLDAHVGGTTAAPVLTGTARVVRGDFDFSGKRFEFDERGVVYLSTHPEDIRLDLTATREDPSLTAAVRILGTAAKPEITLTSTPVLPKDEVLSQVLFGRSASQLSPLEAAQLASALSALAGGGGFDVIGNLRTFAGLDRLALGGGESGVTVSGGKYLTEDVYLELTGGGREGPSAQVEWRVGRNLSILSRLAGQGDARLAVRWRRDY